MKLHLLFLLVLAAPLLTSVLTSENPTATEITHQTETAEPTSVIAPKPAQHGSGKAGSPTAPSKATRSAQRLPDSHAFTFM